MALPGRLQLFPSPLEHRGAPHLTAPHRPGTKGYAEHSSGSAPVLKSPRLGAGLLNIVISSMSPVEAFPLMGLLNLDYVEKKERGRHFAV